jgi:hypothetical protein
MIYVLYTTMTLKEKNKLGMYTAASVTMVDVEYHYSFKNIHTFNSKHYVVNRYRKVGELCLK